MAASAALLLLTALAACQTTGEGTTGTVSGVGEAGAPSGGGGASNVAAMQSVRFDANEFMGYTPERVLPVLGAPDFVRRDGNAQIWQYRAPNCILDLFLYKVDSGTQVKHAELRPRAPAAEALDVCYSRMRQDRKTKPSG
jgi:hypothetical protein